jgi:hypothetical protein
MYKRILSAAIAVLPFAAFAADGVSSNAELTLPDIVVRGHPLIDTTEAAFGTGDTAMALKNTPGFSVYSAGGAACPVCLPSTAWPTIASRFASTAPKRHRPAATT